MQRFTSARQAQRFLSAFAPLSQHFQPRRHRLSAKQYRTICTGQISGVEGDNRRKTRRRTTNPPQYFTVFGLSLLYNSAIIYVPTNKLTIPDEALARLIA